MIKNYLKVAFRNIFRHKSFSFINILGLAVGMSLCILILVYVRDELTYDSFHEHSDRIFRIAQVEDHNGVLSPYMQTGGGINTRLKVDYPEAIEETVRIFPVGEVWTKFDDKLFKEERLYVVDESFFKIFSFDIIAGDRETALKEPNSIALNKTTSLKYFGRTDTIGKMVIVDIPGAPLLKVTAVFEDMPGNSHFHPDLLVSLSTIRNEQNNQIFELMFGNMCWSYILIKPGYQANELEIQFPEFLKKHLNPTQQKRLIKLYLQPLKDIHLRSSTDPFTEIEPESTGNITYLYIFSVIALVVLVIACINFMNLSTARSTNRAREVGMRKVVGAERKQLIGQFLGESMSITLIALPLALVLAYLFLPFFNAISGKHITISYFDNPVLIPSLLGILMFVGFVSGSYPAFFLSSFRPINVLRGKLRSGGSSGMIRKILVIGQFAVSIGFLVGILIIMQQMNFMRSTKLGFNQEDVVVIQALIPEPPEQISSKIELLVNEYQNNPKIISITTASGAPSEIRGIVNGRIEGTPADQNKLMVQVATGFEFLETLGIELIEGRTFSRERGTDIRQSYIINETVARELGLESPVGKKLILDNQKGTIIGVMKDIHWEPKRRIIFPMVFYVNPQQSFKIIARLDPSSLPETLAFMEKKWNENISSRPFQASFLKDMIDNLYKSERQLSQVVLFLTLLSIFIACLGLFGLASFTAEQRTKEIGIRKILGASISGVVFMLFRQFAMLILISNVIAWPISYFILNKWLQNFYYRISIPASAFAAAAGLVFFIAFLSISFQSVRAALANPTDSLRYE